MADVMYFIRLDEGTYQRRKYCYRLNECIVKFRGFSKLGLMPKGILYAIKPLIVGLIPIKLLNNMKISFTCFLKFHLPFSRTNFDLSV